MSLLLTPSPIDPGPCVDRVRSPSAGAVALFLGTVRDRSGGRTVRHLEYEAYPAMCERVWADIVAELRHRIPQLLGIACTHRTGRVAVGETSVVIAAASPHREAAIEAIRAGIDRIKEVLPIWKKETFEDGSAWVGLGSG